MWRLLTYYPHADGFVISVGVQISGDLIIMALNKRWNEGVTMCDRSISASRSMYARRVNHTGLYSTTMYGGPSRQCLSIRCKVGSSVALSMNRVRSPRLI